MCAEPIIVPAAGAEKGGKLPLPTSTPRLRLRRFSHDDSVKLVKIVAQDDSSTLPVTETNVEQWIEEQRAVLFTRGDAGVYLAVELVEGKELAGFAPIYFTDGNHNTAGFGLTIIPARRRQGLGLEATRALLDFAFNGLCARRVAVSCPGPNIAARGMLEKAGMRQEGEMVKAWLDGSEWVNLIYYGLLKEERSSSSS